MDRNKLINILKKHGQEHILKYYDELPEEGKNRLSEQINNIDWKLLELINIAKESPKKGSYSPIKGMTVKEIEINRDKFEEIGLQAIRNGKVGALVLAGGQGTRLGCDGPKGVVNIGVTRDLYIFERLFISAMEVVRKANTWIHFYIMTSEKNNRQTVDFLREHKFFGYSKEHVTFFIQDMAPSVDHGGKLLLEEQDQLSLSPNGNGGWFASLAKAGLLDDLHSNGIEWVNVFSVDNVLQKIADPVFIGATIDSGCVSGAKVVRKVNPDENVGVLCLEDGRPTIVEYFDMTDEMRHMKNNNGELSYSFGVILNYIFRIDKLEEILNQKMPVHVVEKKIPFLTKDEQYIVPEKPNGYKFEVLITDMIHLLDSCLPFEVIREKEFAPVKNATGADSMESARELLRRNGVEL